MQLFAQYYLCNSYAAFKLFYVPLSGPFPVLSLMVGGVVDRMVPNDTVNFEIFGNLQPEEAKVVVASSITFLMGIFQVS